ncbi:hypothetical protein [Enterococcus gilvus]|uniref:hypothetical protein n=1 Tax=Enterococcus gilvus TaxID=160453 RepID=UPI00345E7A15
MKYDKMGEKDLEDNHECHAGCGPEEKVWDKLAQKERHIQLLEMENDLFKNSKLEKRSDLN